MDPHTRAHTQTRTHTQIINLVWDWKKKPMECSRKGNVEHCVKMNEHSTPQVGEMKDRRRPLSHRASSSIPPLIAASNDVVREAAGPARRPSVLAQIRVRYRHLSVAPTPGLLERRQARFIKSAKRIAPSSSSFAGNKEQWAVIQPRNESGGADGAGGGRREREFFC